MGGQLEWESFLLDHIAPFLAFSQAVLEVSILDTCSATSAFVLEVQKEQWAMQYYLLQCKVFT